MHDLGFVCALKVFVTRSYQKLKITLSNDSRTIWMKYTLKVFSEEKPFEIITVQG